MAAQCVSCQAVELVDERAPTDEAEALGMGYVV